MDILFDLLAFSLMGIALVPLLVLGLYVIADRLKFAWAERLLAVTVELLKFQWVTGGFLNMVFGAGFVALGVWLVMTHELPWQRVAGALLVPYGLWRLWRGAKLLNR